MHAKILLAVRVTSIFAVLATSVAVAQDRSTYPTQQKPRGSGIDWVAFYDRADELTSQARAELRHQLDIPYGEDPKQKLDLYLPQGKATGPVYIFIHGGGFVEGDRAHYGYVARPLAAKGIVTVVMSYRLSPAHYPDQVHDVQTVLEWVYRHIGEYGGDPSQIYIGGHSAGAILSTFVSVNQDWLAHRSLPADLIKGYVPISGPYDLRETGGFVDNYLPDDSKRAEASPILNIHNVFPKAIVAVGSEEQSYLEASQAFVDAVLQKEGRAELIVLEGMAHDGTALSAADPDGAVVGALIKLIEGNRPKQAVVP